MWLCVVQLGHGEMSWVGLGGLRGLLQPQWLCDSVVRLHCWCSAGQQEGNEPALLVEDELLLLTHFILAVCDPNFGRGA